MEEFEDLTNDVLIELYQSDYEYSYILQDGRIKHTNIDAEVENIDIYICHSDFETMFTIKDELLKRGIHIE